MEVGKPIREKVVEPATAPPGVRPTPAPEPQPAQPVVEPEKVPASTASAADQLEAELMRAARRRRPPLPEPRYMPGLSPWL